MQGSAPWPTAAAHDRYSSRLKMDSPPCTQHNAALCPVLTPMHVLSCLTQLIDTPLKRLPAMLPQVGT